MLITVGFPSAVYSPDGHPLYSWRVLILTYLDQKALYDRFDLSTPWTARTIVTSWESGHLSTDP